MDKAKFFNVVRPLYGPTLETSEVKGTETILDALTGLPLPWTAYALATALHETNKTMQPVIEAYWLSEEWRKKNLRYWPWHGRGYVQLTWKVNYELADKKLNMKGALIADPNQALEPEIAARIMRFGMVEGWFTKKSFQTYLPKGEATDLEFKNARRIINGTDKKELVAAYALQFQEGLRAGGYV